MEPSTSVSNIVTKPSGSCDRFAGERLAELTFGLQLTGDEPDRHDPVLLGGVQQPLAGALPGALVLEPDLTEASEGVADMGLVVDRQPPSPV